jgi:hypothetical protein
MNAVVGLTDGLEHVVELFLSGHEQGAAIVGGEANSIVL